jgi:hypothetical protein
LICLVYLQVNIPTVTLSGCSFRWVDSLRRSLLAQHHRTPKAFVGYWSNKRTLDDDWKRAK